MSGNEPDGLDRDLGFMDDPAGEFRRACGLASAGNYAEAAPIFEAVMNDVGCSEAGYKSCINNLALCYGHLGDGRALSFLTWTLNGQGQPLPDDVRRTFLELYFAVASGSAVQAGDAPDFLDF